MTFCRPFPSSSSRKKNDPRKARKKILQFFRLINLLPKRSALFISVGFGYNFKNREKNTKGKKCKTKRLASVNSKLAEKGKKTSTNYVTSHETLGWVATWSPPPCFFQMNIHRSIGLCSSFSRSAHRERSFLFFLTIHKRVMGSCFAFSFAFVNTGPTAALVHPTLTHHENEDKKGKRTRPSVDWSAVVVRASR